LQKIQDLPYLLLSPILITIFEYEIKIPLRQEEYPDEKQADKEAEE